ncbi:MAG: hypothetical protein IK093_17335 [Ruminiclostridium sp.]|nr:hypothetical protein [Ruminiclostridium sp.]
MLNDEIRKLTDRLKDKLLLAESADEIKNIIAKAGGEITAEDAEKLLAEIKQSKPASGVDIDDDEMDAVAGGRDWQKEGCAATCEPSSNCWGTDYCRWVGVNYSNFWTTCPDGSPHNMVFWEDDFMGTNPIKRYKCSKCGFTKIE